MKMTGFFALAIIFICHHQLLWWLVKNEERRLKIILKSVSRYCRLTFRLLSIEVYSNEDFRSPNGSLVVCNHLSYIDALILYSLNPGLFVTSVEIQHTFLLGQLASLSGCFFVERRKALRTEERRDTELEKIKHHLEHGYNVFLFPEGTSSNGQSVLPFKANFFQVAIDSGSSVSPLCVRYLGDSAKVVPWYGKMTFPDHLYRICLQDKIEAWVRQLELVPARHFSDRYEMANYVQRLVKDTYEKH